MRSRRDSPIGSSGGTDAIASCRERPTSSRMPHRYVAVPGGAFMMGSETGQEDERPVHRVHVDAFHMSICPVTRREYAAFLAATGHDRPREWDAAVFAGDDLPVVGVS